MQQFFVDDSQIGREYVTITGRDVNHIKNVLRMRPGEKIRVSGSTGEDYYCVIAEIGDAFVQADITGRAADTELPSKIYLFQALPKKDRMEYVIQKTVELGVYEIIPVSMRYCVARLDPQKAEAKIRRWQAISESAAKQSKRSTIPKISPPMSFRDAAAYAKSLDLFLVPYEDARGMEKTRETFKRVTPGISIGVMIGPEGGFAGEEIEAIRKDANIFSLGRRILRTDTAAACVMSALMLALECGEGAR